MNECEQTTRTTHAVGAIGGLPAHADGRLTDPRGCRTGFPGADFETTLGWIYHITPWCISRPEVRFDWTSGEKAYDNGTRREQFTFNWDIIFRS